MSGFGTSTISDGKISTENSSTTPLGIGGVFTGTAIETLIYSVIVVSVYSDQASATDGLEIQQSSDGTNWDFCDEYTISAATGKTFSVQPQAKFLRVVYTNGSVGQSEFRLQTTLKKVYLKPSSHRIQDSIIDDDDAELTKSVLTGEDGSGVFQNTRVTSEGVLFTMDFLLEVSKGNIPGHRVINKFGYNPDVDTGTDPEDVWAGGGIYNFFPTTAQSMEADSTSGNDLGTLVSSGTATGGSTTTLIDTGADFVTDGVAVGDVVINDTNGEYGIVTVVAATQLTHTTMTNASQISPASNPNESGDTYRVATNGSTGAGVIHVLGLADNSGSWDIQSETVIMNGTTDVALQKSYIRMHRAFVVIGGTPTTPNVGNIQVVDDNDATAIGAFILAAEGQTEQTIITVPSGKTGYFLKGYVGFDSGSTVANRSVRFTWRVRNFGGVFRVGGRVSCNTSGSSWWQYKYEGAPSVSEKSDILVRADEVSDDNSAVVAGIDMLLIDN